MRPPVNSSEPNMARRPDYNATADYFEARANKKRRDETRRAHFLAIAAKYRAMAERTPSAGSKNLCATPKGTDFKR